MEYNLRKLYESVREVREGNLGIPVSTQNALRHVKSQQFYEGVREGLIQKVDNTEMKSISVRNLANLCGDISFVSKRFIDSYTNGVALKNLGNGYALREIEVLSFNPHLRCLKYEAAMKKLSTYFLNFDYESFLIRYFNELSENVPIKDAFRNTFTEVFLGDETFLVLDDGRKISFQQLINDESLLLVKDPIANDSDYINMVYERFTDSSDIKDWILNGSGQFLELSHPSAR